MRREPPHRKLTFALVLSGLMVVSAPAAALSDDEVQARFDVLDADGDSIVQRPEYEMTKVRAMFSRDRNGDGRLVLDETQASPEAFGRLDADGDGQLSGAELVLAPELQFDHVDRDHDGTVTLDEFDTLMDELTQ